jgi:hypothetical protein
MNNLSKKSYLSCIFVIAFVLFSQIRGFSQAFAKDSLLLRDSILFDFWVGDWELSWSNPDGSVSKGKNKIEKIVAGKVIQENFADSNGFIGTSISVFNKTKKTWHQAWADNSGGYFNFIGEKEGDKRIFKTEPKKIGENTFVLRMVFYDIKSDSFVWDWQRSNDNGLTWSLNWRINYKRKNS